MTALFRRSLLSLALLAPVALVTLPVLAQDANATGNTMTHAAESMKDSVKEGAHNTADSMRNAGDRMGERMDAHTANAHEEEEEPQALSQKERGAVVAITTAVVFLILLAILTKVAFGPIAAGLKKREDKIRLDIETAEKKLAEANAVLARYNQQVSGGEAQVRAMMAEATANAEKIKASIKAQADAEAAELREKAKRDVQAEKDAALREIQEQAVYLSTTIAEKILKRNLNADDNRDLVRSSLEQLGSVSRN